jgi:hypothetical protein
MEKLDKERYLKRVIIVCWIALAICFGIKLFGGNLFEIMCDNENFIKVCEYADNHIWADFILSSLYCFVSMYFLILAMCGKYKYEKWQLILLIVTVLIGTIVKIYSQKLGVVFDIWQIIIMPCVFTLKTPKRHFCVIIGNILVLIFQAVSLFVRDLSFGIVTENGLLIGIIYSIDVTIMYILYYLYSNFHIRKEK